MACSQRPLRFGRLLLLLGLASLGGCGGVDQGSIDAGDASTASDGERADTAATDGTLAFDGAFDGAFAGENDVCDTDPASSLPACRPDLVCCYPCGIPGCDNICLVPCSDSMGCVGGCPLAP